MVNFRIIARVFGLSLIFEGLFMLLSGVVSFLYGEPTVSSFIWSALITIVSGAIIFSPIQKEDRIYGNKEGYIIVAGIWFIFSIFGTLPYLLSGSAQSIPDAFFEAVSGFTTTGATIFTDVEKLPRGILFWRSLTQWIGGTGILFISLSAFPVVKSIHIQLAATEFSGQPTDKINPRVKNAATRLLTIYSLLTLAEVIMLLAGGMPLFDSVCHSLSTISTGGFSTHNNGFAAFSSPFIKAVVTLFMFLSGTNFTLLYFALKGNLKKIRSNNEFVFYLIITVAFTLLVAGVLWYKSGYAPSTAISEGAFHVVSIITTTGFYTHDFNLWSSAIIIILFLLMFTGGCAGSSSGGIKIVRLLLITRNNRLELHRLIHPNAFIPVKLNNHSVSRTTIYNMLIFITIYFLIMCSGAFVISVMGYDITTAFSTSASMLGNIGPGFGTFGPFTNYESLPLAGKLFLPALMIVGRLELLTVMVLFTAKFYRQ